MVVTGKKRTNSSGPTVRFAGTSRGAGRRGILKTDGRRHSKISSENARDNDDYKKSTFTIMYNRIWVLSTIVLLCAIVALSYRGYLDTQAVNYPYQGPKVIQKNRIDQTLWGTYRPGAYLGLRTKEPLEKGSVSAGLMWYTQQDLIMTGSIDSIRYMCDNNHKDLVYGYVEHDAFNYGHQIINDGKDNGFRLQTIFLRPNFYTSNSGSNTDWTTRIIYETNKSESSVSLIWYVYIDPGEDKQPLNNEKSFINVFKSQHNKRGTPLARIMGYTPSLGNFKLTVIPRKSNNVDNLGESSVNTIISSSSSWCPNIALIKQCLAKLMAIKRQSVKELGPRSEIFLVDEPFNKHDKNDHTSNFIKNLVAVQITISHGSKKSSEMCSKFNYLSYTLDIAYTQKDKETNVVVFKNTSPSLIGNEFDLIHTEYSKRFRQKFERTFPISLKENMTENDLLLTFARNTFSNMAGSLGYFYGSSFVRDDDEKNFNNGGSEMHSADIVKYWKAGLLTAVPSRSQFPRGFLWDDGFHGLMLGTWSIELELHILGHWMDLLNYQGWIPREQILGSEARTRVPEEFIVQSSRAANPPALLLTVDLLLRQITQRQQTYNSVSVDGTDEQFDFDEINNTLKKLYPRLKTWYTWFNRTQKAVRSYSKHSTLSDNLNELHNDKKFVGYRWRGRDSITNRELNPKTLTSGMDDFPRSSHPVNDDGTLNVHIDNTFNKMDDFDVSERHVDLHCWMAHGARIMNNLHNYLQSSGIASPNKKYSTHFWMLVESLDRLHWTAENNDNSQSSITKIPMFADYGIHTDDVMFELDRYQGYVRIVGRQNLPKWRFVDSHIGYNALFPMFFRLVKNADRLNAILDLIEGINGNTDNHSLLTKSCGLRSLSKSSPLYKIKNTMDDPPYWRGSIWINMQYLACSSLYYYANLPEEQTYATNYEFENLEPIRYLDVKTKKRCRQLYDRIRNDVIQCVYKEWKRTGYVWEQYEDEPVWDNKFGSIHKGKGTRPFTGWSANVVLLMAEIY